jgi:hypothetical protein
MPVENDLNVLEVNMAFAVEIVYVPTPPIPVKNPVICPPLVRLLPVI